MVSRRSPRSALFNEIAPDLRQHAKAATQRSSSADGITALRRKLSKSGRMEGDGAVHSLTRQQPIGQWRDQPLQRPAPQSLIEVGDQILSILQPDGGAHDAVAHPLPHPLLLRGAEVGHAVNMGVGRIVEE